MIKLKLQFFGGRGSGGGKSSGKSGGGKKAGATKKSSIPDEIKPGTSAVKALQSLPKGTMITLDVGGFGFSDPITFTKTSKDKFIGRSGKIVADSSSIANGKIFNPVGEDYKIKKGTSISVHKGM